MFGDGVRDEITANILEATGYPNVLNVLLVIFIAISKSILNFLYFCFSHFEDITAPSRSKIIVITDFELCSPTY